MNVSLHTINNIFGDNIGQVVLVERMGGDLAVARSARVSYNAEWRARGDKTDTRLIDYLVRNHHDTPMESTVFTFQITAPIFVVRQWHRHRTWSYNEVSARYTELDIGFYVPAVEVIGTQSTSSKQARAVDKSGEVRTNARRLRDAMRGQNEAAFELYRAMLADNCPRELARSVLPVAAYTRFFGTVNMLNLWKFLKLRLHPHAQWEIRQYARALYQLAEPHAPIAFNAFFNNRLNEAEQAEILDQ